MIVDTISRLLPRVGGCDVKGSDHSSSREMTKNGHKTTNFSFYRVVWTGRGLVGVGIELYGVAGVW